MSLMVLELAVKASCVIAAAALINASIRNRSAAARHLVWTLAIVALLALPIASVVLPVWPVAIPVARTAGVTVLGPERVIPTTTNAAAESGDAREEIAEARPSEGPISAGASWSWLAVLPLLYAGGVFVLLARLAAERWAVSRLARRATAVTDDKWRHLLADCVRSVGDLGDVRLLRSLDRSMPMAFGIRRPSIVVPAVADTWSEDRRRAVLLHELAHIARRDCLTQLLAAVACAVYWIHPGVWWVARRLRVERELACDDRVLGTGASAREYAEHLLELAFTLGSYRSPALVVSMARPRQVEGRMLAVLDQTRHRTAPSRRSQLACGALAAAVLVPLAAVQATLTAAPQGKASAVAALPEDASARAVAEQHVPGTWEVRGSQTTDVVYLRTSEGPGSSNGRNITLDELTGLSRSMLSGPGGPVQFSLRRDAGTFNFEGAFRSGVGAGTYTFTPSAGFPDEMVRRGFARPTVSEQYLLAQQDIGFAFLDELNAERYARPDLPQLVNAGRHGVDRTFVREMGALGYRLGTLDGLIRFRDHGISAQYIRDLSAQGLPRLSADDLVRARDHGVSPEYVGAMRALGFREAASVDGLLTARDHGVSPEYVKELKALGYELTMADLVAARDHGVSPEYVKALTALGHQHLSLEALVAARDHGVSPEYAAEIRSLGYTFTLAELAQARDHGIDARFLQQIGSGGTNLTMDQIVALKDQGGYRLARLKQADLKWYFHYHVKAFHQWVRSLFPA